MPFLGARGFFSARGEYFQRAIRSLPGKDFSFYVGQKHVIGLHSAEGKKTFFENKDLNFAAG